MAIKHCGCPNAYQDQVHGPGLRVMNKTTKGSKDSGEKYRCTSCGTVK